MIILSRYFRNDVKKVHCPICGARLCDVKSTEFIRVVNSYSSGEIILKCYKCKSKIGVSMQRN